DVQKRGPILFPTLGLRIGLRQRDPCHVGNLLDGFGEVQSFKIRQETEMVAGDATAEAVVAPLAVFAVEARAFLAVKRAAGPVVAPRDIRLLPVPGDTTT